MKRDYTGIPPEVYDPTKYDSQSRFATYWYQIEEVRRSGADRALEVGIGNGFVHKYLRGMGMEMVAVDIDEALAPDVVARLTNLPFRDAGFQTVLCAEVLEHLEFRAAEAALRELSRVAASTVIVSIPDARRCYRIHLDLPRFGALRRIVSVGIAAPNEPRGDYHVWELGLADYPTSRFLNAVERADLILLRTYRVFESPYHRFFVLAKGNPSSR